MSYQQRQKVLELGPKPSCMGTEQCKVPQRHLRDKCALVDSRLSFFVDLFGCSPGKDLSRRQVQQRESQGPVVGKEHGTLASLEWRDRTHTIHTRGELETKIRGVFGIVEN